MLKFIERVWDGLTSAPLQTVGALIIFLLALPLIRAGFRDKPADPAPPAPSSSPIEIESPWFVQNFLQVQKDVDDMKSQLAVMSGQLAGITSLLKRRAARKPPKS